MSQQKTQEITISSLHRLHQQQLSNGANNIDHTVPIVNILGGIDSVLSCYLNETNKKLNKHQLIQLKTIIKTNTLTKITNNKSDNQSDNINDNQTLCYTFHENNTYLHSLFDENKRKRITKIFQSKIFKSVLILLQIFWIIPQFVFGDYSTAEVMYKFAFTFGVVMPYSLYFILSCDRTAVGLILVSFEFWFKVTYALFLGGLNFVIFYKQSNSIITTMLLGICNMFGLLCVVIGVSVVDAFKVDRTFKIVLAVLILSVFIYYSIHYQFLCPEVEDYVIHIKQTNSKISIASMISNAMRILAIFIGKQVILTYVTPNKCALIRYTPYYQWANNENVINDVVQIYSNTQLCDITHNNQGSLSPKSSSIDNKGKNRNNNTTDSKNQNRNQGSPKPSSTNKTVICYWD